MSHRHSRSHSHTASASAFALEPRPSSGFLCVGLLFMLVHFVRGREVGVFGSDDAGPNSDARQDCIFHGVRYSPGDSWIHDEECAQCTCADHGLSHCRPINCELVHAYADANSNTHAKEGCQLMTRPSFQNASCCPVCADCDGHAHGMLVWEEDECTTCWCVSGQKRCHSQTCRVGCIRPELVTGECCPKCPVTDGAHGTNSIPSEKDAELDHGSDSHGSSSLNVGWVTLALALISFVCVCVSAAVVYMLRRNYTRLRMRQGPERLTGLQVYRDTEASAKSS